MATAARAQRLSDLRPAAAAVARRETLAPAPAPSQAPTGERRRQWGWYTLGGAIIGGGAVAVLVVRGCRDDCMPGLAIPVIGVGALAGAAVGTVVGLVVDASRRE